MRYAFCPHCMTELDGVQTHCPRCGRETEYDPHVNDIDPGTELRPDNGKIYRIGKTLGVGSFSITYIAKELLSGDLVAVKEYFPRRIIIHRIGLCPDTDEADRKNYEKGLEVFEKEVSELAALDDLTHIVHVRELFFANNTAYMVMEYLDGTTLIDYMGGFLETYKRLEPGSLIVKMLPLMRDIHEMHGRGILHRDIAPYSIMMMPDGTFRLLDFISAHFTPVNVDSGFNLNSIRHSFNPVENFQSTGQGSFTDVYSVAATIYFCMTGIIPTSSFFRFCDTMDGQPDPIVPLSKVRNDLPEDIEQLLMRCLEPDPCSRVQTMKDFADMLETMSGKAAPEPQKPQS